MKTATEITETAEGYFQTLPTDILVAAINGIINLNYLAKATLANRGLDKNGEWVGFEEAHRIHKA